MTRKTLRALLLVSICVLYAVSIPWYRKTGEFSGMVFGLPDWVAVAIGCYAAVALLNMLAWMLTDVSDELDDPRDHDDAGGRES